MRGGHVARRQLDANASAGRATRLAGPGWSPRRWSTDEKAGHAKNELDRARRPSFSSSHTPHRRPSLPPGDVGRDFGHELVADSEWLIASRRLDADSYFDNETAADLEHDFHILKPILESRGHDIGEAAHLCDLPSVQCYFDSGDYFLDLEIVNKSLPAVVDAALFDLKRLWYLRIRVSSGPMPPGIEAAPHLGLLDLYGTTTGGLEGPLPPGFWSLQVNELLIAEMGPRFTGSLDAELPVCAHLYSLYLYEMPSFSGDISSLKTCTKLRITVSIWGVPFVHTFIACYFSRLFGLPEIVDIRGLDGPWGPGVHSKRWWPLAPTFWNGLRGPSGRPDPEYTISGRAKNREK